MCEHFLCALCRRRANLSRSLCASAHCAPQQPVLLSITLCTLLDPFREIVLTCSLKLYLSTSLYLSLALPRYLSRAAKCRTPNAECRMPNAFLKPLRADSMQAGWDDGSWKHVAHFVCFSKHLSPCDTRSAVSGANASADREPPLVAAAQASQPARDLPNK